MHGRSISIYIQSRRGPATDKPPVGYHLLLYFFPTQFTNVPTIIYPHINNIIEKLIGILKEAKIGGKNKAIYC